MDNRQTAGAASTKCTDELMEQYSLEHYTFINQIFGDATVREILMEVYPNKKYVFFAQHIDASEMFEEGYHHVLVNPKNQKEIVYCSVDMHHQRPTVNINDTLCQSYSLLKYLGKDLDLITKNSDLGPIKKLMSIHREFIDMYRRILANKKFVREFTTVDFKNSKDAHGRKAFRNYTKNKSPALNMDSAEILTHIATVLDKWEAFGYRFFIGNGKCPKTPIKRLP